MRVGLQALSREEQLAADDDPLKDKLARFVPDAEALLQRLSVVLEDVEACYKSVRQLYGENRDDVSEADFCGHFLRFVSEFVRSRDLAQGSGGQKGGDSPCRPAAAAATAGVAPGEHSRGGSGAVASLSARAVDDKVGAAGEGAGAGVEEAAGAEGEKGGWWGKLRARKAGAPVHDSMSDRFRHRSDRERSVIAADGAASHLGPRLSNAQVAGFMGGRVNDCDLPATDEAVCDQEFLARYPDAPLTVCSFARFVSHIHALTHARGHALSPRYDTGPIGGPGGVQAVAVVDETVSQTIGELKTAVTSEFAGTVAGPMSLYVSVISSLKARLGFRA